MSIKIFRAAAGELTRIKWDNIKYREFAHAFCKWCSQEAFLGIFAREETVRKDALRAALYCGYVVEVGESIPRALLNGIGTAPRGHAELEDLYYVKVRRNELLGTFVSFLLARTADRSIGIISPATTDLDLPKGT